MKALVLAAGTGTRLRPLTDSLPKVMLELAEGLPLLEHVLRLLLLQGIREFVVNLHYLPEKITGYFGDGARLGASIEYSDETPLLMDTAGAVRKAASRLGEEFLLVYGDQLHLFDVRALIEKRRRENALAALALKRSDAPQNGDLAETEESGGRIVRWHPRPHGITAFGGRMFLNSGLYAMSAAILRHIPEGPCSLDREVLPRLVAAGEPVFGVYTGEEILDIGTPEKYSIARDWYARHKRKALFLDRDGVILRALPRGEYLTGWRQAEMVDGIGRLLEGARAAGYLSVVVTNQSQVARGLLSEKGLLEIHERMRRQLDGRIDAVYYCPHRDEDRCGCRKPKAGMIEQAAREWNIDPASSWMVGDSDRDVLAGQAAGCRTAFIRNEHNTAELARCAPDFVAASPDELLALLP